MFKAEIIGNIGADVEIKDYQGGKFATFRVAHSVKYRNQAGQETETTTWIDVTMNDTESKILQFLKAGTKVFVRGNANLRVYSSPKLKQMVAGLTISAWEIELCGGVSDIVPRQLIDPSTGALFDVTKYYWCNHATEGMKEDEFVTLIDKGGREYMMNFGGFVQPIQVADGDTEDQGATQVSSEQPKEQIQTKGNQVKEKGKSKSK